MEQENLNQKMFDIELGLFYIGSNIEYIDEELKKYNLDDDITDFIIKQLRSDFNFLSNYYEEQIKGVITNG